MDYNTLARGIEVSEMHSIITESQALNSSEEKEALAYMAGTPKEKARHFEQQAQVQREHIDMIHAQKESIDRLKQILLQLFEDKRRSRRLKLLPRSPRANRRKGKTHLLHILKMKRIPTLSHPSLHLKRRLIQRTRVFILKG